MLRQRILSLGLHNQLTYSRPIHQLHHAHSRPPSTQNLHLLRAYRSSAIRQNPSNTLQATPFEPFVNGTVPPTNLFKAFIFTGAFSAGCYAGATILEYENARQTMLERARQTKFAFFRKAKEAQGYWQDVKRECQGYWDHLTPGQKVFAPICALNVLVFALWRVPRLSNTMMTYFCSNPAGRALCWPMFLSTFSHYSLFHICANMYVLHSFCNAAVQTLGKEQFLGMYLTAGVVASLTSVLYKAVTFQPGLSIGASGAIMAILGYVCSKYPDMGMSIVFLPMIQFPAGAAIKVIMAVDIVGCVMRWKFFDHAAHLGGALFGVFWAHYGAQIWSQRVTLLSKYHDWRRTR